MTCGKKMNQSKLKFTQPNFDLEWYEAARIPEFNDMGKITWQQFAKTGQKIKFSDISRKTNHLELLNIDPIKKQRFEKAFEKGVVEMPIVVKLSENEYEILAGKTRINQLCKKNIDADIWLIDISNMMFLVRPM